MNVFDQVGKVVSKLADSEKESYICITMGKYVCENDSTFNQAPGYAGGLAYYKTNSEFKSLYEGSSSTKMASTEALSNFDDCDYIISNRSVDYGVDIADTIVTEWEKYMAYYENLDDYQNLVYINNVLPGACKIAYLASILCSSSFSDSWADGIMSEFMSTCVTFQDYDLDDIITFFTYEDYISVKDV